jgi:hypothetical protein
MATAAARKAWNEAMKQTAGAALPNLQKSTKRRSDRHKHKNDRRKKACKVINISDNDEFRTAVWIDALEGVDSNVLAVEDDEEFDELEELDDKKRKRGGRGRQKQKVGVVIPKRFLPRSLGTILVEEANRGADGVAREFLQAVAKVPVEQQLPRRKFCPVTGQIGLYTEPKSGIPYSSLRALEQIRERAPPWMSLGGAATYHEAVKSIEDAE